MSNPMPDLQLLQLYRKAEYYEAELLQRLSRKIADPRLQIELTRQIADEARHALLWTTRMYDLGGTLEPAKSTCRQPVRQQSENFAAELALFAQLYVTEEKLHQQYQDHLARSAQDPQTKDILETILADEMWHRRWAKRMLTEQSKKFGHTRVVAAIDYFWHAQGF